MKDDALGGLLLITVDVYPVTGGLLVYIIFQTMHLYAHVPIYWIVDDGFHGENSPMGLWLCRY